MAIAVRDRKSLAMSKLSLLEKMEKLLDSQRRDLADNDIARLARTCVEVDKVIGELREIDVELLRLEPADGCLQNGFDSDIGEAARMITELSEKNKAAIDYLLERLYGRRTEIKCELEQVVASRQIGGYRPFVAARPLYLDRQN